MKKPANDNLMQTLFKMLHDLKSRFTIANQNSIFELIFVYVYLHINFKSLFTQQSNINVVDIKKNLKICLSVHSKITYL